VCGPRDFRPPTFSDSGFNSGVADFFDCGAPAPLFNALRADIHHYKDLDDSLSVVSMLEKKGINTFGMAKFANQYRSTQSKP
jgi:hypothetical protein